jgi:hypothetical protein
VKPIKMLGLAVAAALMAMALVGASSAMATESTALCEVHQSPCPEANIITHVHEETLSGEKGRLLSSSLNVECKVLFLGESLGLSEPPESLIIHGNFTYSECNSGCTATEENGPALIEVLKEGHETATVIGEGLVHLNCSGFINCRYNGVGLVGTGVGPLLSTNLLNGHTIISEKTTNKESGSLCPATGKLDLNLHPLIHTYIET